MINYVYQGNKITLNWTVKKGVGLALEDFSRASTHLFLIHGRYRFDVPCTTERGVVSAELPENLAEGIYSAEILWVKNFNSFTGSRNLQRTRVDNLFCVTVNESEADSDQAPAEITVITVAHAYGYDGLSAYEAAVFRGYSGTEEEYYNSILKYEVVVTDDPDFPDDGIWRFVKETESSESYSGMYFGDKVVTGSIIPGEELAELHDLYTSGIDTSMLSASLRAEVEKLSIIGVIDIEDLDTIGTTGNRLPDTPARYVVTQAISNYTYKVGVLDVFSEGPGRVVTEVLTTHNILSGGQLQTDQTYDGRMYQYFRSCKLNNYSTLDIDVGEWTEWQELAPSTLEDTYATKAELTQESRVVSQSASVTCYVLEVKGGTTYYTSGPVLMYLKKGQIIEVEGDETTQYVVLSGSILASGYGKTTYKAAADITVNVGSTAASDTPLVTIYDTLASLQARIAALENG